MASYNYTLTRARMSVLSANESAASGFTHKYTIPYSDITGAGATTATDVVVVTLGATPALYAVRAATVNITTAFAGTTALTLTVGTTSSANAFIASTSVLTAGRLNGTPTNAALSTGTAAVSMTATFTNATGGSISALTAGSLDIYLALDNDVAGGLPSSSLG